MLSQSGHANVLTNVAGRYASTIATGIYDPGIVCAACEAMFSPWDKYAQVFLRDRDWSKSIAVGTGTRVQGIMTADFDYSLLKLFFASLLWRASVSTQPFFDKVELGSGQDSHLRQLLQSSDAGQAHQFSVLLGKFDGPPPGFPELDPRCSWLDPHGTTMGGHHWIKFYLLDWTAYIKTDQLPLAPPHSKMILHPSRPLCIIQRNYASSKELRLMWQMAQQSPGHDEIEDLAS